MIANVAVDKRAQIEFVSVDSAPKRFAGPVSQRRAPAMLVMFCLMAMGLLLLVNTPNVSAIFPNRDFVFSPYEGHHAIAVRIFIISFFASFAMFSSAGWKGKTFFSLDLVLTYVVICGIFDLTNSVLNSMLNVSYSLHFSAIISGLLGFSVYSFKLLERGRMPVRIPIEHRLISTRKALLRILLTIFFASCVSAYVGEMDLFVVEKMRDLTLLGGIGPGIFLFFPTLFAQLYVLAIYDVATAKRSNFRPPVSIIVPAHNEQYIIADTIKAMDKAAAHYNGEVHILIMNNNSTDETETIARETLHACTNARGRVINVPMPGKSNALNTGLDAVETEFIIRVDADTLVGTRSWIGP